MPEPIEFEFPVNMLGPRGVGKTSMLAAITNEFQNVAMAAGLHLTPDAKTAIDLQQTFTDMKRMCSGRLGAYVEPTVKPGMSEEVFTFTLSTPRGGTKMKLKFHDFPGGWLMDKDRAGDYDDQLKRAAVIFVAVDVPALMELDCGEINFPNRVSAALGTALHNDETDWPHRLIVFVPMRGELWFHRGEAERVYERFVKSYKATLDALEGYAKRGRVAGVYCPIQTLGAVEFAAFKPEGDRHLPRFRKVRDEYQPVDCDQPLRYLLRYIVNMLKPHSENTVTSAREVIEKRHVLQQAWFGLLGLLGYPDEKRDELNRWIEQADELLDLAEKFGKGCKRDASIRILQNPTTQSGGTLL